MLIQNPEVTNKEYYGKLLPPQGFRPEAKSRGGIITVQIYSRYTRKNLDLLEQGPRGIGR